MCRIETRSKHSEWNSGSIYAVSRSVKEIWFPWPVWFSLIRERLPDFDCYAFFLYNLTAPCGCFEIKFVLVSQTTPKPTMYMILLKWLGIRPNTFSYTTNQPLYESHFNLCHLISESNDRHWMYLAPIISNTYVSYPQIETKYWHRPKRFCHLLITIWLS